MKKIFTGFVLSVFMIFGMCACGGKGNSTITPDINKPFCVNAEIDYDDNISKAKIQRYGKGSWKVEFSEPNTLAGVVLTFDDANVEASYKGLSFSVPKSALPLKSVISGFIDVVDKLAEQTEITGSKDDDVFVTEGEAELGNYEMKFDKTGMICSFEMPNLDLEMNFTQCEGEVVMTATENSSENSVETESENTSDISKETNISE